MRRLGKLVQQFTGDGRTSGRMTDTGFGPERSRDGALGGIVIDGAVYPLDGQPDRAPMGSWGNMSWLRSPYYTGLRAPR